MQFLHPTCDRQMASRAMFATRILSSMQFCFWGEEPYIPTILMEIVGPFGIILRKTFLKRKKRKKYLGA